jgi:hypothetical protein
VFNLGNRIVVEWKGTTFDDAEAGENLLIHFQVVLHPDGNVEWNFKTMNWNRKDGDMFTGAYAKDEDIEFEADYEIKRQTSFKRDFSESPTDTSTTSSTSTTTTTSTSTTSTTSTTSISTLSGAFTPSTSTPSSTTTTSTTIYSHTGDIDNNGKVETLDGVYLAKHVLDFTGFEEIYGGT